MNIFIAKKICGFFSLGLSEENETPCLIGFRAAVLFLISPAVEISQRVQQRIIIVTICWTSFIKISVHQPGLVICLFSQNYNLYTTRLICMSLLLAIRSQSTLQIKKQSTKTYCSLESIKVHKILYFFSYTRHTTKKLLSFPSKTSIRSAVLVSWCCNFLQRQHMTYSNRRPRNKEMSFMPQRSCSRKSWGIVLFYLVCVHNISHHRLMCQLLVWFVTVCLFIIAGSDLIL